MSVSRRTFLSRAVAGLAAAAFGAVTRSRAATPVEHAIRIVGFRFVPDTLHVAPGDAVVWINEDIAPHTATADDGSWDTGTIAGNATARLVIEAGQTGGYHCRHHPAMLGRLV